MMPCLKVYFKVISYAPRYLARQKGNPGVRRHLLQGITSLLILAPPQTVRLPPRDPRQNKCQRRGGWRKVKPIMVSLTVQSQLGVIRFNTIHLDIFYDFDRAYTITIYCRGVPSQLGHSTKHGSSRQRKRISLIENKQRIQWGEMTCLRPKEGNMLGLAAAAILALLLALFPPRTSPQVPSEVSPTPFQGAAYIIDFWFDSNLSAFLVWVWVPQGWVAKWLKLVGSSQV